MQVVILNDNLMETHEEFEFLKSLVEALENPPNERSIYFPDVDGAKEATVQLCFEFSKDYEAVGVFKFVCKELGLKMNYKVEVTKCNKTPTSLLKLRYIKINNRQVVTDHSVTVQAATSACAMKELVSRFGPGGMFRSIVKI
jgi:hypothetical protein